MKSMHPSFKKIFTSKPDEWRDKKGTEVGAARNVAKLNAAAERLNKQEKERKSEIEKRNREAEKRKKEALKMAKEEVTEARHVFHVHMKPMDMRQYKMVDDDTFEPVGAKPKGDKLIMKISAADSREARNKLSKHIAKNYGVSAVKSIEYKGLAEEMEVTEAMKKQFIYHKPDAAYVALYNKRDTSELKDMHARWSGDHKNPKSDPITSEKLLAVHHVLKNRGESVGELPQHKNLGMMKHTFKEEVSAGTEARTKMSNVGRPNEGKEKLGKQGEIQRKVIDESKQYQPSFESKLTFGLPENVIETTRRLLEKKTEVELEPETNDSKDIDEEGTKPKTAKEKKLAALAHPKGKITHIDKLTKEELENLEAIAAQFDEAFAKGDAINPNGNQDGIGGLKKKSTTVK